MKNYLKKIAVQLLLALTTVIVVEPAFARTWCSAIFEKFSATSDLSHKISTQYVADWLTKNGKFQDQVRGIPKKIKVNGKSYSVVALLGAGSEASVFLAESNSKLVALKVYNRRNEYDIATFPEKVDQFVRTYRRWLPKVLDIDEAQSILVLEYKQGLPVDVISEKWKQVGLSESQKNEILFRYDKWVQQQLRSSWFRKIPNFTRDPDAGFNVVYSFEHQQFYLIDPL